MRTAWFLLAAVLSTPLAPARAPAYPSACTSAAAACTEWVALGGGPARSMVYRSHALDARNDTIRRALIMVHGTNRNADHYFRTAIAAAFLAGAVEDTLVVAPHIVSADRGCADKLEPNEVSWSCTGDSWRSGGVSTSHPDLTSFDFIDQILRKAANKSTFPRSSRIAPPFSMGGAGAAFGGVDGEGRW